MEFRTQVTIEQPPFAIEPEDELFFIGSCFADNMGQRFRDDHFRATVNPFGTMYNPASVLHTVERLADGNTASASRGIAFITLGTNHVYRLRTTGQIVDNCEKRPQSLFQEEELTVDQCAEYLLQAIETLRLLHPDLHVVLTVSPIRYRKYGFHGSQLSKATLLLAVEQVINAHPATSTHYFPAYELMLDELRDYRFYKEDMLHPSAQAVDYLYEQLATHYFSPRTFQFLREWKPLKEALAHRPFHPESAEYQAFIQQTKERIEQLNRKYHLNEQP